MTTRNLQSLFKPKSVAVLGASERPGSLGQILLVNLRRDFQGTVYAVNPKYDSLLGQPAYRSVAALPTAPDLAVIATPPRVVPQMISELGLRGTRGVCVITAGFGEGNDVQGLELRQQMLNAAQPHLLRIVGPNGVGLQVPEFGLNASFVPELPLSGDIAVVAQSGAIITAVLDWAGPRGIGFSHTVSLGDMADVDFGDMLDYLADDLGTRSILLYIESVTQARKFMSAARSASRIKPVVVVKAGRFEAGARAAASHTGALAGKDDVYDAAFRRAGLVRVFGLEELFDVVEALSLARLPEGERLTIVTNGGGIGVLAADCVEELGLELAELSAELVEQLNGVLPLTWSHQNPVDIIGDASPARYKAALEIVMADKDTDAVLVMNCPTALTSSTDQGQAVIDALPAVPAKTLLTSWVGERSAREPRERFMAARIPTFDSPEDAVKAFGYLVERKRVQQQLLEAPAATLETAISIDTQAKALVAGALGEGREWLNEYEAKQLLSAYGIPVVDTQIASSASEVGKLAKLLGGQLVLKVLSKDVLHKTDVGGVLLNVAAENAESAAERMLEAVREAVPEAVIGGITVQPMITRPGAIEIIAGMIEDSQFGPVMLIGHGGTAVEIINDKALALPPLNLLLAREMLSRTRVSGLLQGYRNVPASNVSALVEVLVALSQLVVDVPEVAELDINPLLVDAAGVIALDARVRLRKTALTGSERLAIRPYPRELEETVTLLDGSSWHLRPIVPTDDTALVQAFYTSSEAYARERFFIRMKRMTREFSARLTQIDYDRQMALVLADPVDPSRIVGIVRLTEDPDGRMGEVTVIVQQDLEGQGIVALLLGRIGTYAQGRGLQQLYGLVLSDNDRMLGLCKEQGFTASAEPNEPGVDRITKNLAGSVLPRQGLRNSAQGATVL